MLQMQQMRQSFCVGGVVVGGDANATIGTVVRVVNVGRVASSI